MGNEQQHINSIGVSGTTANGGIVGCNVNRDAIINNHTTHHHGGSNGGGRSKGGRDDGGPGDPMGIAAGLACSTCFAGMVFYRHLDEFSSAIQAAGGTAAFVGVLTLVIPGCETRAVPKSSIAPVVAGLSGLAAATVAAVGRLGAPDEAVQLAAKQDAIGFAKAFFAEGGSNPAMGLFVADLLLAAAAVTACAVGIRALLAGFISETGGLPYRIYQRTQILNAGWGGLLAGIAVGGGIYFAPFPNG